MAHAAVLSQVDLFAELSKEELESLGAGLERRRYTRGRTIFVQGDPGANLYIVETGKVKITVSSPEGKALMVNILSQGEFFGELALLDGETRSADAVARENCQLLLLSRNVFLRFLRAHPDTAIKLLAVVARRLRQNTQLAQDTAFLDLPARLAQALLLVASPPTELPAGEVVIARATQSELAEMVGATRESINKWLSVYRRQGLIRSQRGAITILRPDELRKRIY